MSRREKWQVPATAAGERLDRHLARFRDLPRNQVQRHIRQGRLRVDGASAKPSQLLAGGEWVEWEPPDAPADPGLVPEAGELDVLYEDSDLIVLDKASGVVVHPGAGQSRGTLVHFLLARYPEIAAVGSRERPGIVHRLDQGTSGVLVVARSDRAYRKLAAAFAAHEVAKAYLAVVYGRPTPATGRIDTPVGRHPRERKRMTVRAEGRPALTRYRTLASGQGISVLLVDLATGRTHQIRVHLKSVGHPLVGDPLYGEARWRGLPAKTRQVLRSFPRPALHAWRLGLRHPASGTAVDFEAPLPADLEALWQGVTGLGWPSVEVSDGGWG